MYQIHAFPNALLDKVGFKTVIMALQTSKGSIRERIDSLREKINSVEIQAQNKNEHYDDLLKNITKVLKDNKPISDECTAVFKDYQTAYHNITGEVKACVDEETLSHIDQGKGMCISAEFLISEFDELLDEARECRHADEGFMSCWDEVSTRLIFFLR